MDEVRSWRGGGCSQTVSWQVEKRQTWTRPRCRSVSPTRAQRPGNHARLVASWKKVSKTSQAAFHCSDGAQMYLHARCLQTERQCRRTERNPEGTVLFELGWVATKHKYSSAVFKQIKGSALCEGLKSDWLCYFCSRRLFVLDGNETLSCFCTGTVQNRTLTGRCSAFSLLPEWKPVAWLHTNGRSTYDKEVFFAWFFSQYITISIRIHNTSYTECWKIISDDLVILFPTSPPMGSLFYQDFLPAEHVISSSSVCHQGTY